MFPLFGNNTFAANSSIGTPQLTKVVYSDNSRHVLYVKSDRRDELAKLDQLRCTMRDSTLKIVLLSRSITD